MGAASNDSDGGATLKDLWQEGSSKEDPLAFPAAAKHDMGYQLHRVQKSRDPDDRKPPRHLGRGVTGIHEIRTGR